MKGLELDPRPDRSAVRIAGVILACVAAHWARAPQAEEPAEEPSVPELITDRPDQTESPATIPPGYVQIETGVTYSVNDDDGEDERVFSGPETLIRIGLMRQLELRLGTPAYNSVRFDAGGSTDESGGWGDADIGIKYKFFEESGWRPETALLASMSLPTGANGFSSERADPAFRFAFAHTLSDRLSLGYNLGAAWETSEDSDGDKDTLSVFQYTATLGVSHTDRLGSFYEFFGDIPMSAGGGSAHSFDAGLTYLLTPSLQLDGAVGVGLSNEADDWFVTMGVSYLFPIRSPSTGTTREPGLAIQGID